MSSNKINHDETNPNSFLVTLSILITVILIFIIIVFSFYYYRSLLSMSQNSLQDNARRHPYITDIESNAKSELNKLKWIDKEKGLVQVPIDVAKSHVIKEYK